MLTFTNPFRLAIRPEERPEERTANPSATAIALGALAVGAVGVGGYMLYRRTKKPAVKPAGGVTPGGGEVPGGGETPGTEPQEPLAPQDKVLLLVQSPYMTGNVTLRPGESKQYEVYANYPRLGRYGEGSNETNYSTTEYYATQDEAETRLQLLQWYFGRPSATDDIYVSSRDTGFFDSHPRGAVWQSAEFGDFYYSIVGPGGMETPAHSYPGIDMAENALWQDLQSMV